MLAAVLALLITVGATFAVTATVVRPDPPDTSSPSAGFARDMSAHHAQAVQMSFLVRERTKDEDIRALAFDIINTQATQRGMMMGWLEQWGLPLARPGEPMAWTAGRNSDRESGGTPHRGSAADIGDEGHAGDDHTGMPGMATQQQLSKLRAAQGRKAEVLFLQLMIQHHHGGVMMAKAAVDLANRSHVRQLAQAMVTGQKAEIELMTQMLRERGTNPLPWPSRTPDSVDDPTPGGVG